MLNFLCETQVIILKTSVISVTSDVLGCVVVMTDLQLSSLGLIPAETDKRSQLPAETASGFDLAWFSSLSSEHLCIFNLHGAVYIVNFCGYIFFLTF